MYMPDRRTVMKGSVAMTAFSPFFAACGPQEVTRAEPAADAFLDGVRTAELVADGGLSAAAAADAAIARAEAVNPQINAIATPDFEGARAMAAAGPAGHFGGVPTFIKDLADWRGLPTLFGSRAFAGYVAPEDGPLAAAWRDLGIVVLGKSTSPEMGLISSTEPLVTGPTRNPWDTSRIPGGSSGGAAALTAARVVPFAHASDGGGSIRIPAACCGLFGLKPSVRVSPVGRASQEGAPVEISVDLAVSHTVRDSAAIFAATARTAALRVPVTGPDTRRLRIGFAPDPLTDTPLDPEVRRELEATAALCRELGHEVMDVSLPLDGNTFSDRFLLYWSAGAAQFAADASAFSGKPVGPDIVEPWTLLLAQNFAGRQSEMPDTIAYLQSFRAVYEQMFADLGMDILLTPTVSSPAPPVGSQNPAGNLAETMQNVLAFAAYTSPMNVAGAASMTVPLGQSAGGLPIGSMFSGIAGDDRVLLALAYELEAARPWIGRKPTVIAS